MEPSSSIRTPPSTASKALFTHALSYPEDQSPFYPPGEDTYLFLDTIRDHLLPRTATALVGLEVGPGSGALCSYFAMAAPHLFFIACDINPAATLATLKTASNCNVGGQIDSVLADFSGPKLPFRNNPHPISDFALCNPPYVPSPAEEVGGGGIEAAWAGGDDGRKVIDLMLPNFAAASDKAVFLLMDENVNKCPEVHASFERLGFNGFEVLSRRKCMGEKLAVFAYSRE